MCKSAAYVCQNMTYVIKTRVNLTGADNYPQQQMVRSPASKQDQGQNGIFLMVDGTSLGMCHCVTRHVKE